LESAHQLKNNQLQMKYFSYKKTSTVAIFERLPNLLTAAMLFLPLLLAAQVLPDSIRLGDSTVVQVFPTSQCEHCFRYVPFGLRVPKNEAKQPEASLLKISETENDPVTGGIMHVMLVWGLDARQEADLQERLRTGVDSLAVLLGAATVENPEDAKVSITGDDKVADLLRSAMKNRSGVANIPGVKMAVSFRFDEAQVKPLLECLAKPCKTDAAFEIDLRTLYDGWRVPPRHIRLSLPFTALMRYFN
jgi:hypothetical protein